MLPLYLRVLLVLGAVMSLAVVGRQVSKSKILVEDAVFWCVLAAILVLLALFPDPVIRLAASLGFMSASNFVYLVVIVLLLWKAFTTSAEVSRLKTKVNELAQEMALDRLDGTAPDEASRPTASPKEREA